MFYFAGRFDHLLFNNHALANLHFVSLGETVRKRL